jgi:probable F420-dependent oxidoreductase
VRPIVEATSTLVAATGIRNVWINDPAETAAADAALRRDFPRRFMLGIGIGHPEATSDYRRPLHAMRTFLDGLDAAPEPPPADDRCLPALGPKMLDLAASGPRGRTRTSCRSSTRSARERLGPGKLIATEVACVVETDPARAKAVASDYATLYLGLRNYTRNLLDFGFAEDDFADGGSDRPARRDRPPGQCRAHRRGRPRAPRRGRRSRLRAAARRGGRSARLMDGARPGAALSCEL